MHKVGQQGRKRGARSKALKRKTQLGTPPVCQRHFTRPHGTGRVPDAESIREGVESVNKVGQHGRPIGARSKALKRKTQLGTPPVCQRHFTRPHGTGRVPDAESIREGVESVNKVGQHGRPIGARSKALKRKTQLGTPPVCQRHFTRPHGTGRVPDAESIREGVESVNKKLESMRERAARPKSTEEGDIAWSASRVPASLHATTWHREGSRRRVYLGGRGKFEQGPLGVKSVARRNIRATLHGTTAP